MRTLDIRSRRLQAIAAALLLVFAAGCASMNKKERGAVIGAGAGAVVGGVIGNQTGSTARGAIIGAVVGGVAGAIIGHQMDQQAEELEQNIPGATVERVGEGIQVTFASGLLFDFDSDVIRGEARENLDELASSLEEYDGSDLLIVGHTDGKGTESYNQDLSERRAQAARRYLASRGVDAARIDIRGRGEYEPVASNETESGRQLNRRVEVAIYASEEARAAAKRQAEQSGL
jgi:outer membrane protein OmpA-like peptidoglycan-associated protein